jgi:hypothetical protein
MWRGTSSPRDNGTALERPAAGTLTVARRRDHQRRPHRDAADPGDGGATTCARHFRAPSLPVCRQRAQTQKLKPPTPLGSPRRIGGFDWSGRLDLNQRPLAPQASALPGCATPRRGAGSITRAAIASTRKGQSQRVFALRVRSRWGRILRGDWITSSLESRHTCSGRSSTNYLLASSTRAGSCRGNGSASRSSSSHLRKPRSRSRCRPPGGNCSNRA